MVTREHSDNLLCDHYTTNTVEFKTGFSRAAVYGL